MGLNTTPRTWVAGERVTAAQLNVELRDALAALQAAWVAYPPTLSGITLGNGSLSAAYHRIGKTIFVRSALVAGSTTAFTAGATVMMSLPVAPHASYGTGFPVGPAFFLDSSVGSGSRTIGVACAVSSNVFFVTDKPTSTSATTVTDAWPWTWAAGDQLYWSATYEAAA